MCKKSSNLLDSAITAISPIVCGINRSIYDENTATMFFNVDNQIIIEDFDIEQKIDLEQLATITKNINIVKSYMK